MNEETRLPERKPRSRRFNEIMFNVMIVMIIGTISLVGVLYSMALPHSTYPISTPAGSWEQMEATSSTEGYLTFGRFTLDIPTSDVRINVYVNGAEGGFISVYNVSSTDNIIISGPSGAEAYFFDLNPDDGTIDLGDHIILTGLEPDTTYSFELFHLPSDSIISMTGPDSFTTEP